MFYGWSPIAVYAFIFFAKIIEVTINTIRIVLATRGNRVAAAVLATAGISIWLVVTSVVLLGIEEDPLRGVFYGLAFALGVHNGMLLEEKLAIGLAQIEVIAECEVANEITSKFRELGYRVTTYNCEGYQGEKVSVVLKIHRKDIPASMELLKDYPHLFVTITDIRKLSRGTIHRSIFPH
jgi:uncharacterized protein YebE (UPF0316 family)